MTLLNIFTPKPERWGLRGDPHLWDRLANSFESVALPCDKVSFLEHFKRFFLEATDCSFEAEIEAIFVPEFDKGGMSSGDVSMKFWHEEGLPLLLSRLEKFQLEQLLESEEGASELYGLDKDDCLDRTYPGVSELE